MAMASSASPRATNPPRDTRTQLFVGNVRPPSLNLSFPASVPFPSPPPCHLACTYAHIRTHARMHVPLLQASASLSPCRIGSAAPVPRASGLRPLSLPTSRHPPEPRAPERPSVRESQSPSVRDEVVPHRPRAAFAFASELRTASVTWTMVLIMIMITVWPHASRVSCLASCVCEAVAHLYLRRREAGRGGML